MRKNKCETERIIEIKPPNIKVSIDPVTREKFVVDLDTGEVTNISHKHEDVIKYSKRWEFKPENWKYERRGKMVDGKGYPYGLYVVENKATGEWRFSILNEIKHEDAISLTQSNSIQLIEEISKVFQEKKSKKDIPYDEGYEWFLSIIDKRYAIRIIGMLLRKKEYGITAVEVNEEFNFKNLQKARDVLAKFKRVGFLNGYKKGFGREMFYVPTIPKNQLKSYIKRLFEEE